MPSTLQLSSQIRRLIACPRCGADLEERTSELVCQEPQCSSAYPIVGGVPVLIDESRSTFKLNTYRQISNGPPSRYRRVRNMMKAIAPRISANVAARANYAVFRELVLELAPSPVVLVIGGSEIGQGMRELVQDPQIEFIETDVALGSRTRLACEAQILPFKNQSMDGLIIQAVLEYIPDCAGCVDEIYRVLKPNGIVYSEFPFMQQVHGGDHDFTRLTHLGHCRLYNRFDEIRSGACGGPGMALAWSLRSFAMSLARSQPVRDAVRLISAYSLFWLKYFDYFLARTRGGLDAASGTYFLGRKSDKVLTDQELIGHYRGACSMFSVGS